MPRISYEDCEDLHGMSFRRSSRNSGDITFGLSAFIILCRLEGPALTLLLEPVFDNSGDLPLSALGEDPRWAPNWRRCTVGAVGKLSFLSIAWTARSKRWKSDSARVRSGTRSIVLESSLTIVPF